MPRKTTDSETAAPVETAKVSAEKPTAESNQSGFYCYIGPNIKGLIQGGSIFRGTRAEALEKAKKAIQAQPLVKALIVSGDALPKARLQVKKPGNALYVNYQKLTGK